MMTFDQTDNLKTTTTNDDHDDKKKMDNTASLPKSNKKAIPDESLSELAKYLGILPSVSMYC